MFSSPMPPSTWIGTSTSDASSAIRSRASGMNACPEYPGTMLMQRTISACRLVRRDGCVARARARVEGDADGEPVRPRAIGQGTWIGGRLDVEGHRVGAGRRELLEVVRRVVDHQMAVEHPAGIVDAGRDRPHDDRADRHRWHEMAVTAVEVENAAAGRQEIVDLLAEAPEVGGVERRLDLHPPRIQSLQPTRSDPRGVCGTQVRSGEGMHQAAWSARSACRLDCLDVDRDGRDAQCAGPHPRVHEFRIKPRGPKRRGAARRRSHSSRGRAAASGGAPGAWRGERSAIRRRACRRSRPGRRRRPHPRCPRSPRD